MKLSQPEELDTPLTLEDDQTVVAAQAPFADIMTWGDAHAQMDRLKTILDSGDAVAAAMARPQVEPLQHRLAIVEAQKMAGERERNAARERAKRKLDDAYVEQRRTLMHAFFQAYEKAAQAAEAVNNADLAHEARGGDRPQCVAPELISSADVESIVLYRQRYFADWL